MARRDYSELSTGFSSGHSAGSKGFLDALEERRKRKEAEELLTRQLISSGQIQLQPGLYSYGRDGKMMRTADPNTQGRTTDPLSFIAGSGANQKKKVVLRYNQKTGQNDQVQVPEGTTDVELFGFDPTKGDSSEKETPQQKAARETL